MLDVLECVGVCLNVSKCVCVCECVHVSEGVEYV